MQYLETLEDEKYLNLREPITDRAVDYMIENDITILNIEEYLPWNVSENKIKQLGQVITELNISDTETPLGFVAHLFNLKILRIPDFSSKKFSCIDFEKMHDLLILNIESASQLPKELSKCDKLETLHICGKVAMEHGLHLNQIKKMIVKNYGDFGMSGLLARFGSLTELKISRSRCTSLELQGAASTIQKIYAEFFPCCEDLTPLVVLKIKNLHLSHFKRLSDLGPLSRCVNLQDLALVNMGSVVSATPLSRCSKLESLYLDNCPGIDSLGPLVNCNKLKELFFCEGTRIKDGKIKHLLDNPALEKLRFDDRSNYDLKYEEIKDAYDNNESCWL